MDPEPWGWFSNTSGPLGMEVTRVRTEPLDWVGSFDGAREALVGPSHRHPRAKLQLSLMEETPMTRKNRELTPLGGVAACHEDRYGVERFNDHPQRNEGYAAPHAR